MDISSFVLGLKMGNNGGGGGSSVTVESLSVTENGTTTAPSGKAYSPVVVNVPNSYTAGDEGKVVSNGALVSQSSDTVTANNTYDTTLINSLTVNVPTGGGASNVKTGSFTAVDNSVITIPLNYTGNGYPVAAVIWADKGADNTTDPTWSIMNSNTIYLYTLCKITADVAPTYNDDTSNDNGAIFVQCYKNDNGGRAVQQNTVYPAAYTQTSPDSLWDRKITFSDKTTLNIIPKSSTSTRTSFIVGIKYNYCIYYSE